MPNKVLHIQMKQHRNVVTKI